MLDRSAQVVIVGNGAAGLSTAQSLRTERFDGAITFIGDETGDPYDRPPLSKKVLTGAWSPEQATLLPARRLEALEARFQLGSPARSLDLAGHAVALADGTNVTYDELVIATGVRPRELAHENLGNVFVLRTMEHTLSLRAALSAGNVKLVVIGAGFLGLEIASAARLMGADVTVVEPVPGTPLAGRMGSAAAEKLAALHEKNGVRVLTGVGVTSLSGPLADAGSSFIHVTEEPGASGTVKAVQLTNGVVLEADVVLMAIGSDPNVEWLSGSGLSVDNGVVCDEWCRASAGVWAAGDVARWLHRRVGRHVRLEHRTNAGEQGHAVARNMLGHDEPFLPVPFFWTDHYDVRVQFAGLLPDDAEFEVAAGSVDSGSFVQRVYGNGVLVGVLGWNAPREALRHRVELSKSFNAGV